MIAADKILEYMKVNGPVIPSNISKFLNTTILMASALLSDLSARGKVKISSVKVGGGSPVYYLPEHKDKLQDYSKYLHEKEQRAYNLLKESKVLRESLLDPLTKVALQQIKDYAVSLKVTIQEKTEIFWRWYLITDKDAEPYIRSFLFPPSSAKSRSDVQENPLDAIKPSAASPILPPFPSPAHLSVPSPLPEEPKHSCAPPPAVLRKKNLDEEKIEKQPTLPFVIKKKPIPKKQTKTKTSKPKRKAEQRFSGKEDHMIKIQQYFSKQNISVISSEIVRKGREYSFRIDIPSPVGSLSYHCNYINKKKITEKDVSSVCLQGQMEKLPVLILSPGDPSKKVIEKLSTHFKGVTIKKI